MAKLIPMITGAIKEGAQKLISVFTKAKTGSTPESKSTVELTGAKPDPTLPPFPEEPTNSQKPEPSKVQGQPTNTEPDNAPLGNMIDGKSTTHPSETSSSKEIEPLEERVSEDTPRYTEEDKAVQESSAGPQELELDKIQDLKVPEERPEPKEPTPEQPTQEPPTEVTPEPVQDRELPEVSKESAVQPAVPELPERSSQQPSLPELPEWPKAVMESSGMTAGSSFSTTGNLTLPPPAGPLPNQTIEPPVGTIPNQSAEPPAPQPTPGLPQGMPATEQVVPGYSRTERLLEQMLLRGIPTLKPPRGP